MSLNDVAIAGDFTQYSVSTQCVHVAYDFYFVGTMRNENILGGEYLGVWSHGVVDGSDDVSTFQLREIQLSLARFAFF